MKMGIAIQPIPMPKHMPMKKPIGNYPRLERGGLQALTVARMVPKTVAPGAWRAVSTTVRIAASP
jgi:hypothetical protein